MTDRRPRRRAVRLAAPALAVLVLVAACGQGSDVSTEREPPPGAPDQPTAPAEEPATDAPSATETHAPPLDAPAATDPITISLRLDRRVGDTATEGFVEVVRATLTDPRGWEQAGFRFRFDEADAPYTVVLAEGPEVDDLCAPYDTGARYSCQIGPVVALNADRWREATPQWTGDLPTYRQMLVNHEVGHLLGQNHPTEPCPAPGEPAPVMTQQSTNLQGCLPNPWPLPWELDCAAIRDLRPIAPPFERVDGPLCGPDGPVR